MSEPASRDQRDIAERARRAADAEVLRLARDSGAQFRTRPIFPGSASTTSYAEPETGLAAARALELAAARKVRDYIRHAREEGIAWGRIGAVLNLSPDPESPAGYEAARASYDHAAGDATGRPAWSYDRSFTWTCPSCESTIRDRGPDAGRPEDAEPGHANGCSRLAAQSAAYDAEWEAGE